MQPHGGDRGAHQSFCGVRPMVRRAALAVADVAYDCAGLLTAAGATPLPGPWATTTVSPASISTMPAATSHRRLSPHPTVTTLGERSGPHRETGQSSPPGQVGLQDLGGTATSEPERRVDLPRRGRPVEREEVQAR